MTRSQRMKPVLRIAQSRKLDAARGVARTSHKLREYENKLAELRGFRDEYARQGRTDGQLLQPLALREGQKFIRRLDAAMDILRRKVAGLKQSSAMDRQVWMDACKHTDSIDRLLGRLRDMETGRRETRADNEIDDQAQYRKPKNGSAAGSVG